MARLAHSWSSLDAPTTSLSSTQVYKLDLIWPAGAFGLLPYMALWTPPEDPPTVPPPKKDMEGVGNLMLKGMESPVTAAIALLGGAACIYQVATAGPEAWADYFKLFDESR